MKYILLADVKITKSYLVKQAFRAEELLFDGPTKDFTIQSEPAKDCFEALHLQVQLQEKIAREIGAHLKSGLPIVC